MYIRTVHCVDVKLVKTQHSLLFSVHGTQLGVWVFSNLREAWGAGAYILTTFPAVINFTFKWIPNIFARTCIRTAWYHYRLDISFSFENVWNLSVV